MPGRRVVITGLGVVTSLGSDVKPFWERLVNGDSGISTIEAFDVARYRTHIAGEIKNFEPTGVLDAREQRRTERFSQFALVAACRAVEDAGINFSHEDPYRCGVVMGSGVGGLGELEKAALDPTKIGPMVIPKSMPNAGAGLISIRFGLKGPNGAITTACASASNAIGDSMRMIRQGEADVMITGGSEAAINGIGLGGFCAMRALSTKNSTPTTASRPFDRGRDGFVLSEGGGVIVLEEYEHAIQRGAHIYGEMLGYGSTMDASHITAPDPEGNAAANAMRIALFDARVNPADVDYINAHGTGTPLGDVAETRAMKKVFKEDAYTIAISSTKSQLGHSLGASGGVEMVITALAMTYGVIPPTINLDDADPDCDLDYTAHEARERPVRFAMSNSFAFGGHNASLLIGRIDLSNRPAARQAA